MDQKRVTLVVSDLHMGDGTKGDDFVDNNNQFTNFIRERADTEEGRTGETELIVNGDFLEFVQVLPEKYTLNSEEFWCSESESRAKLESILAGHPKVFKALDEFQKLGNLVTLFPGNHDVDLHWEAVQNRLREVVPGINIETQEVTNQRYGGRLRVSHGHLFETIDPANNFQKWPNVILRQPKDDDPPRLEMCPGTLFVVKYVNYLEAEYPFADNLHPEIALARILAREDLWACTVVVWMFLRFGAKFPKPWMSSDREAQELIGAQLLNVIQGDKILRDEIASVYCNVLGKCDITADDVKKLLASEDAIADFIEHLIQAGKPWDEWLHVLDQTKPAVSSADSSDGTTLSIIGAGSVDARAGCAEIARGQWKAGAEIVVLGHTHLSETVKDGSRVYYNPGSWTRYVENPESLRLKQLEDESTFPYQLNYIRVELAKDGSLLSNFHCFEKNPTS